MWVQNLHSAEMKAGRHPVVITGVWLGLLTVSEDISPPHISKLPLGDLRNKTSEMIVR